jgi:segregation and condensation protein B
MNDDLKYIIESLLFVSETPLTMDHLKGIIEGQGTAAIRTALDELMAAYEQRDGGFVLKQVAGGYQFRTQGRYNAWIKRLIKPSAPRLSKAALETLAIIAYNQPVIRSDIEHIRGVDSGGVIRMLLERKLIRVLGRKEIPGRPLIYATTKHFLEVFELKDLKDLPSPREIEELSRSQLEEASDRESLDAEHNPKSNNAQKEETP